MIRTVVDRICSDIEVVGESGIKVLAEEYGQMTVHLDRDTARHLPGASLSRLAR